MNSIRFRFDEGKAAQVAAVMLRENKGSFDFYLLAKALYDLDREGFKRWGQPVIGGDYAMLEYGPINSQAMDAWKSKGFLTDHLSRSGNVVTVKDDPGADELSDDEIALAKAVARRWKDLTFNEAKRKVHALAECEDKRGLRGGWIPVDLILKHLGKTAAQVRAIADLAESFEQVESLPAA